MTNTQAIILGMVQGLTEYIPVSSSAHLVLVPKILGWQFSKAESFTFDVLVQLGTLVGVFAFFMKPIARIAGSVLTSAWAGRPFADEEARLGWMVVLATIPAAGLGLLCKDHVSEFFSSPKASCYFLVATGLILVAAEYFSRPKKYAPEKKDALFIGFFQSLALLPGISRSGSTIAAGMFCGLDRKNAAFFSFLMSIPIMLGASIVALVDLYRDQELFIKLSGPLFWGFLSASVTGYLVISWFMNFVTGKRLFIFAGYCFLIGICGVFYWSL